MCSWLLIVKTKRSTIFFMRKFPLSLSLPLFRQFISFWFERQTCAAHRKFQTQKKALSTQRAGGMDELNVSLSKWIWTNRDCCDELCEEMRPYERLKQCIKSDTETDVRSHTYFDIGFIECWTDGADSSPQIRIHWICIVFSLSRWAVVARWSFVPLSFAT